MEYIIKIINTLKQTILVRMNVTELLQMNSTELVELNESDYQNWIFFGWFVGWEGGHPSCAMHPFQNW